MRSAFFIAILICVLAAQGEEESYSVSDYSDCAEVEVDFDGDSKIYTAAEMTAMMDKGLYEALSRFDRCQTSAQPKGSSTELDTSSSASVGQAGVGENGDSETGTVNSTASSSVSGVEVSNANAVIILEILQHQKLLKLIIRRYWTTANPPVISHHLTMTVYFRHRYEKQQWLSKIQKEKLPFGRNIENSKEFPQ